MGKAKGDIFFKRHKNGIKVFGDDISKNWYLLKELDGTWNSHLKCWFFPYSKLTAESLSAAVLRSLTLWFSGVKSGRDKFLSVII